MDRLNAVTFCNVKGAQIHSAFSGTQSLGYLVVVFVRRSDGLLCALKLDPVRKGRVVLFSCARVPHPRDWNARLVREGEHAQVLVDALLELLVARVDPSDEGLALR